PRIEIARPRLPLRRPTGLSALDSAFDRLMGGAAQLGGPTVGSDLPIGRDDVHTLPCRLQWNSLGGEVTVGAITVTAQANELPDRHDTQGSGDFYLAISGDLQLATNGDFHLATDTHSPFMPVVDRLQCVRG